MAIRPGIPRLQHKRWPPRNVKDALRPRLAVRAIATHQDIGKLFCCSAARLVLSWRYLRAAPRPCLITAIDLMESPVPIRSPWFADGKLEIRCGESGVPLVLVLLLLAGSAPRPYGPAVLTIRRIINRKRTHFVRLRRAFHSQSRLLNVPSNSSPVNCPQRG